GQVMARLALYRTKGEDLFSDEEVFLLRAFGSHICLAWYNCLFGWQTGEEAGGPAELARTRELTHREGEVLELVYQDLDNPAIMAGLGISRSTLHKHLQSIYRKCGVSSRWELKKLLK
ncbi:MAG: helix-turn-helix transcriptional regulator, partial [Ruminiclostridium sp.]|nr:helix-turn-helix transcriptional regulator [Ruminiclostridium sp.]